MARFLTRTLRARRGRILWWGRWALALVLAGCSTAGLGPRRQLSDAERDYARLTAGPAALLAQPEILNARLALTHAELLVRTFAPADQVLLAVAAARQAIANAETVAQARVEADREARIAAIVRGEIQPVAGGRGSRGETPSCPPATAPQPAAGVSREVLAVVLFPPSRATLSAMDRQTLLEAAPRLRALPAGSQVLVSAYSDPSGPAAYNLALSRARGDAVRAELTSAGVPAGIIAVASMGPFASLTPPERDATTPGAAERRAVVSVIEPASPCPAR